MIEQAGRELNNLRTQRNKADYDFQSSVPQTRADQWVKTAEDIILALKAAAADPARVAAIQAEIIRYEREVLQEVTFIP